MLIIPLMSRPQPTHRSNAARIPVSPPVPAQLKEKELGAPLKFPKHMPECLFIPRQTAHFRVPHGCPELQNRVPGSRSVECGENRNSGGKHVSTGQLWWWWWWRRAEEEAVWCAWLPSAPCLPLLELHHVNNIYWSLKIFNKQVKGQSQRRSFRLAGHSSDHRLSAVHCSSSIRLFVLPSGQTKPNSLPMIQPAVGEDRGWLSHQRHHLPSALRRGPT